MDDTASRRLKAQTPQSAPAIREDESRGPAPETMGQMNSQQAEDSPSPWFCHTKNAGSMTFNAETSLVRCSARPGSSAGARPLTM
jgi:hypothetical protein